MMMDYLIAIVLLILLGLVMKFVVTVRQLDQTKVLKYCDAPPSYTIKAGQFSDQMTNKTLKFSMGTSPPVDTEIKFHLSC